VPLPRVLPLVVLLALVSAAPAHADSLHLVFPQSVEVTVTQGQSTDFTLELQALGAAPCQGTSGPAVVDSIYSVNAAGQVAAGIPQPVPIETTDMRGVSENCYVKTPVLVPLTATAAPDTPVGNYTSVIRYGKGDGPADLDGPALTIHVLPPPAQPVITPVLVPPTIAAPAPLRPTLGKTVLLTLVKGNVTFKEPGQPVRTLGDPIVVRNGTDVDATDGVVKITVVRDTTGALDTVDAWGGAFDVRQVAPKKAKALTTLTLLGSAGEAARHAAQAARNRTNRLWVNGKGNFKTRGKRASAIVRGTYWLTENTEAGDTKVQVQRGLVAVRDFVKRRTVLVSAGHTYTAKPRAVRVRRIPAFTGSA
jgi:hypothetical protein